MDIKGPFGTRLEVGGGKLHLRLPNRIRRYNPEDVTTLSQEVDPQDVGVSRDDVEAIWRSIVQFYRLGLHPAMSICIRRRGQVLLHRTIGHAIGNGPKDEWDEPKLATENTLFNLFSASKSVSAMVVHKAVEKGLISIDEPVSTHVPEFTGHGKEMVTLRHILLHRAGMPFTRSDWADLDILGDQNRIMEIMYKAKLSHPAGYFQLYHAINGGFVLAEALRRVTGKDMRTLLREWVTEPMGLQALGYGVPPERLDDAAQEAMTGPTPNALGHFFIERSIGISFQEAVDMANDPRFRSGIVPSGNVFSTASEAGLFFECLLRQGELNGVRVFQPETVTTAMAEHRKTLPDGVIVFPVRFGLGFMLGADLASFFGRNNPRAFGHLGFTNILAWADPERDISVAFLNNGKPFITPELLLWLRAMWVISDRIPRDYGEWKDNPWRP